MTGTGTPMWPYLCGIGPMEDILLLSCCFNLEFQVGWVLVDRPTNYWYPTSLYVVCQPLNSGILNLNNPTWVVRSNVHNKTKIIKYFIGNYWIFIGILIPNFWFWYCVSLSYLDHYLMSKFLMNHKNLLKNGQIFLWITIITLITR